MSPSFGWSRAAAGSVGAAFLRAGSVGAGATAVLVLAAALLASSGCSRAPHHPGWVIHSSIELIGPPPAGGYRLVFPYIVGDFYGAPNTGAFVVPVSLTAGSFTLDLNRTQAGLETELGPPDFTLRFLEVVPHDTRLARLVPTALQRDGIEPVGKVEWLDARSRLPLMLVYVDRPARIAGSFDLAHGGGNLRYDIRVAQPGYVWIGAIRKGGHDTLYAAVPPPHELVLTIDTSPTTGSEPSR